MKVVEREVTTTVKEYIAYDTKVFKDANECFAYERKALINAADVIRQQCLESYDGSNIHALKGSMWGGDMDEFFIVKVDSVSVYEALHILLRIADDFENIKSLHNAFDTQAVVLVSVYNDESFYWYGDYASVVRLLADEAKELFKVYGNNEKGE